MRSLLFRLASGWRLAAPLLCAAAAQSADIRVEFLMFADPPIPEVREELELDALLLPLWRQALTRPEEDYQRQAAASIAKAHALGFPGMLPATPDLLHVVSDDRAAPTARYAAAHALITLDQRDAAQTLYDMSRQGGADLRQLVEPALGNWQFEAIRPEWRARLADPSVRRRELLLACAGLADCQEAEAVPALLDIALAPLRPADVRLAAARAAGRITDAGLEPHARNLLATDPPVPRIDRLCVVSFLTRHRSPDAQGLLAELGVDADPAVAAIALRALLAIDPALVLPLVEQSLTNADPHVRQCGVDAYVALPTTDRVVRIATLLDDVHPDVRHNVCLALFDLARRPDLDAAVRGAALDVLGRESWRGQEQAGLLLAALDHKPAAPRLLELLDTDRAEVNITSAWALRVLAVPETISPLFERVQRLTEERLAGNPRLPAGADDQIAHLFELLGRMDHRPAEPLFRQHVPKNLILGIHARAAAIWSLGLFLAGEPVDEDLAAQLVARVRDTASMPPEFEQVRETCVVTLGRMRAATALPTLREYMGAIAGPYRVSLRMRWAVMEITGEEIPFRDVTVKGKSGWFLEPFR
jgi:HEAT repeat protein